SLAARDRASAAGHALATLRAERDSVDRRIAELAEAQARLAADRAREGALAEDAATALAQLAATGKELEARLAGAAQRAPALDAALAEAERAARDAEVALAQALSRQASEAAEARVAQAALAQARARLDRAQRDLARLEVESAALAAAEPLTAERDQAAAARAQALDHAAQARQSLTGAEATERTARAARDHAQAERARAHAELAALDSESAALAKATRASGHARLLDQLRPDPGYERALAAALGDDVDAGLDAAAERHWAGATPQPGDPDLPAAGAPLAAHVAAPAALARRLAQVVVVEADAGQPLAVGQRLVTLAGVLRRWDGYVARGGGAAAAERLEKINRRHALEAARPAAVRAVEAADAELARIDDSIAEARRAAGDARRLIEAADARARDAMRAEDRAVAALERLAAQRADHAERAARATADRAEAASEVAQAEAALKTLPDGHATGAEVMRLQRAAEATRAASAEARAARTALDRDLALDRDRLAAGQAEAKSWRARAGDAARRIADMAKRQEDMAADAAILAAKPASLDARLAQEEAAHAAARADADSALAAERAAEAELRASEQIAARAAEALAEARELRAGAAARAENQELRRVEMGRLSGERFECPPPLLPERAGFREDEVRGATDESARHERLMAERERLGAVNLVAEAELAELEATRLKNADERDELGQAVNQLRGSIGTLNREGRQRLRAAFEAVDGHFRRLFTTLFNGGSAHLALIDSDDPLEAGLEIMAQPPGKKLQSLTLLSGGEQALTAVALIFGLFLTNPAPICVLDEVDAPLDDANIERFCDLLDAMTRETRTRYLIVTHNAVTMSRMHRLFGVTMVEQGVSRLVSVDLGGAEALLAA
ncbi:chromosome segregation protein, partial [Sphingomonas sp.]|uniref:chromosome segregation protein n=1 Tax=Sphingomonas sp. TaxID=28214 RepID=UPI001DC95624